MRWLTNFYDFRFKWTATAGIGIHPTKAWLSQLVNFKNAIWTLEEQYVIKFCFKLEKNDMQWKLDLLLWPRDQETEFPVEACWLSQPQEGQTEQIHPQTFDDPFFWQHWHDLHALGSHWTDSQQGILCWGFKGVQEEIPREEASTLQIELVAFPAGQCTSPQLHPCQTIWPRWASRQFLSLPIVQTLLPVTFGYSLSSESVVIRQLRRWKRLWWRSLTCSHKRTSIGPSRIVGTVQQVHCRRRRLLRRGLEFHVCTINKSAHMKKVWKLIQWSSSIWEREGEREREKEEFLTYGALMSEDIILISRVDKWLW